MKKTVIKSGAVMLVLAAMCLCFWLAPVKPLKGCTPQEITSIEVQGFGRDVTLTDKEVVQTIAENIYDCGVKKSGISYFRMGYVYKLRFYKGDEYINTFTVINDGWARDHFFFYSPENGSYCKGYLDQLAAEYRK